MNIQTILQKSQMLYQALGFFLNFQVLSYTATFQIQNINLNIIQYFNYLLHLKFDKSERNFYRKLLIPSTLSAIKF